MDTGIRSFTVGTLKFEVHPSGEAAGVAAAAAAANVLQRLDRQAPEFGVIFATGASQLFMLRALTSMKSLPWHRAAGFHLDEYVGLPQNHPGSFRHYLREHLTQLVPLKRFFEIDGDATDLDRTCQDYVQRLRSHSPQLCFLGVGENGHLAFNDPAEADFIDRHAMKVVELDRVCRRQQFAEGWFQSLEGVPERALTLTIPTLLNVPTLIVSVPGPRKANIVRRMIEEPISTSCPATILRAHPNATVYLDRDSAMELKGVALSDEPARKS